MNEPKGMLPTELSTAFPGTSSTEISPKLSTTYTEAASQALGVNPGAIAFSFQLPRSDFQLQVEEQFSASGITALFGPSGCGKSSLLRAIAGLEPQARGYFRLGEEYWHNDAQSLCLKPQQRPLGLVFQQAHLFPHLNVLGNLQYGLKRRGGSAASAKISLDDVIHWLDLAALLKRRTHALSGGEQQRVAMGRALLSQPRLLLLDEPLSGVDLARRQHIMPFLERLHRELDIPMILVTHQLEEVARLADWVLQMDRGQVLARGPVFSMLSRLSGQSNTPYSVLPGRVREWDQNDQLTGVETPAGLAWVPGLQAELGAHLRLLVQARQVSLALQPNPNLSILNQWPARISELKPQQQDQLVGLDVGGQTLWALVSHRAARQLQLREGQDVVAMVKSVSVLSAQE
jgi:molybdate transport system ATP-binding protein